MPFGMRRTWPVRRFFHAHQLADLALAHLEADRNQLRQRVGDADDVDRLRPAYTDLRVGLLRTTVEVDDRPDQVAVERGAELLAVTALDVGADVVVYVAQSTGAGVTDVGRQRLPQDSLRDQAVDVADELLVDIGIGARAPNRSAWTSPLLKAVSASRWVAVSSRSRSAVFSTGRMPRRPPPQLVLSMTG